MPIDMYLWNLVQENKQAIVAALVRKFDPSQGTDHPIYTLEGEWTYERFEIGCRILASSLGHAWTAVGSISK